VTPPWPLFRPTIRLASQRTRTFPLLPWTTSSRRFRGFIMRQRRNRIGAWYLKFLWSLVLGIRCLLLQTTFPCVGADGQWPMWRHDSGITGHQPLPGAMTKTPQVLAKYFVGAQQGA